MNEMKNNFYTQYLQEEIKKMQKSVDILSKMIKEKDPKKDDEFIHELQNLLATTQQNIKRKQKKLKEKYNININLSNN